MPRGAYEVMKLAFADVVTWTKILEDIRAGERYIAVSYEGARRAIRAYHRTGDAKALAQAAADLRAQSAALKEERAQRQPRNNAEVIEAYVKHFATPHRPTTRQPLVGSETYSLEWGDLLITGRPHLTVRNSRGTDKHLYLITSKDWDAKQKRLLVGLLAEILLRNVPGTRLRDIEGLDCRTGQRIVRAKGLSEHERKRLDALAARLVAQGLA